MASTASVSPLRAASRTSVQRVVAKNVGSSMGWPSLPHIGGRVTLKAGIADSPFDGAYPEEPAPATIRRAMTAI
jgi:hypothetical protein